MQNTFRGAVETRLSIAKSSDPGENALPPGGACAGCFRRVSAPCPSARRSIAAELTDLPPAVNLDLPSRYANPLRRQDRRRDEAHAQRGLLLARRAGPALPGGGRH